MVAGPVLTEVDVVFTLQAGGTFGCNFIACPLVVAGDTDPDIPELRVGAQDRLSEIPVSPVFTDGAGISGVDQGATGCRWIAIEVPAACLNWQFELFFAVILGSGRNGVSSGDSCRGGIVGPDRITVRPNYYGSSYGWGSGEQTQGGDEKKETIN